jgi:hypothetical protein
MIIRRMRFSRSIPKATGSHSKYVIINAFTLQQYYVICTLLVLLLKNLILSQNSWRVLTVSDYSKNKLVTQTVVFRSL